MKAELDAKLLPFRILAAAWSGGVMLGTDQPDDAPQCNDDADTPFIQTQTGTKLLVIALLAGEYFKSARGTRLADVPTASMTSTN